MRDQVAGFRESSKGSALIYKKEEKGQGEGRRGDWRCKQGIEGNTLKTLVNTCLGAPVVPFYPFSFWVPLLKPNSRKKGTLIIKGLLGNLAAETLCRTTPAILPQSELLHSRARGLKCLGFSFNEILNPKMGGFRK